MNSITYIASGIGVTLLYTLSGIFFGLILGCLLSLCKISNNKLLKYSASVYVSIFRGTPLLVQLSLIYFALPSLTGIKISVFLAGILAFSLNSAAYISEIIRAGIQSVDKGQFEAAYTLNIPYTKMMKDIILPQALTNILPALVNELVNLLKETAIISIIGGADLMRRAQTVAAEQYSYFGPLLTAAACYYILVLSFSSLATILERKMKQHVIH